MEKVRVEPPCGGRGETEVNILEIYRHNIRLAGKGGADWQVHQRPGSHRNGGDGWLRCDEAVAVPSGSASAVGEGGEATVVNAGMGEAATVREGGWDRGESG